MLDSVGLWGIGGYDGGGLEDCGVFDVSGERYSRERMLRWLGEVLREYAGAEDAFDEETLIYEYLSSSRTWDDLDFFDVAYAVDREFGIWEGSYREWKRECYGDWDRFFGLGLFFSDAQEWREQFEQRLTFGALGDFLAERTPVRKIEPVCMLGRPCAAAGAFELIRAEAGRIKRRGEAFGPSTLIRERFRGEQLRTLWKRLRWISDDRLPPLRPNWLDKLEEGGMVIGGGLIGASILATVGLGLCPICGFGIFGVLAAGVIASCKTLQAWFDDPRPAGFETFRDVARGMAGEAGPYCDLG